MSLAKKDFYFEAFSSEAECGQKNNSTFGCVRRRTGHVVSTIAGGRNADGRGVREKADH
jgi:hypothetical protein